MDFVDIIVEYLPIFMFLTMGVLLFIGYPVGFILGGCSYYIWLYWISLWRF